MDDQPKKNSGPVDTLRDGSLKATIWKRESEGKAFYNTQFSKSYAAEP